MVKQIARFLSSQYSTGTKVCVRPYLKRVEYIFHRFALGRCTILTGMLDSRVRSTGIHSRELHVRYQNYGLGKMLLHDAAIRAISVSDIIGAKAIVVDPIDENAANFYLHHGFQIIPGLSRMFAKIQ